MDHHPSQQHPALLPHLPPDSLFHALRRLDEARERAVPVLRPAFLAPQQHPLTIRREHRDDDGWIGAWETQVTDPLPGRAVRTLCGFRIGGAADCRARRGDRGPVGGRTGAFGAGVDGERGLAALGAERVARVPVQEGACLGVDCSGRRGERGVHAALEELETAGFERGDQGVGWVGEGAAGGDVESEEGGAGIDVVGER